MGAGVCPLALRIRPWAASPSVLRTEPPLSMSEPFTIPGDRNPVQRPERLSYPRPASGPESFGVTVGMTPVFVFSLAVLVRTAFFS